MSKPITIEIEHKSFTLEVKSVDSDQGIIEGYLSVFNNIDSQKDRVRPGAFKKTIADGIQRKSNKGKKYLWPLLWMHDPEKPIGGFTDALEDKTGLLVTAQLDISTNEQGIPLNPLATSVFSGFKQGYIDELSIGYKAIQKSYEQGTGIRDLAEIQVFEGSAVTMLWAANDAAQVSAVKTLQATKDNKTMDTPTIQKKDFADRYREEQIRDWKTTDFQNLTCALQSAIMDIFSIGDEPQADLVNTILNGGDEPGAMGFIDALKDYVQKGIDIGVSDYVDENPYFGEIYHSSYGYMARNDTLDTKAGAVVSQSNSARLQTHVNTLRTVADDISYYITGGMAYVEPGTDSTLSAQAAGTGKSKDVRPSETPNNDNQPSLENTDIDWEALALQIKAAMTKA